MGVSKILVQFIPVIDSMLLWIGSLSDEEKSREPFLIDLQIELLGIRAGILDMNSNRVLDQIRKTKRAFEICKILREYENQSRCRVDTESTDSTAEEQQGEPSTSTGSSTRTRSAQKLLLKDLLAEHVALLLDGAKLLREAVGEKSGMDQQLRKVLEESGRPNNSDLLRRRRAADLISNEVCRFLKLLYTQNTRGRNQMARSVEAPLVLDYNTSTLWPRVVIHKLDLNEWIYTRRTSDTLSRTRERESDSSQATSKTRKVAMTMTLRSNATKNRAQSQIATETPTPPSSSLPKTEKRPVGRPKGSKSRAKVSEHSSQKTQTDSGNDDSVPQTSQSDQDEGYGKRRRVTSQKSKSAQETSDNRIPRQTRSRKKPAKSEDSKERDQGDQTETTSEPGVSSGRPADDGAQETITNVEGRESSQVEINLEFEESHENRAECDSGNNRGTVVSYQIVETLQRQVNIKQEESLATHVHRVTEITMETCVKTKRQISIEIEKSHELSRNNENMTLEGEIERKDETSLGVSIEEASRLRVQESYESRTEINTETPEESTSSSVLLMGGESSCDNDNRELEKHSEQLDKPEIREPAEPIDELKEKVTVIDVEAHNEVTLSTRSTISFDSESSASEVAQTPQIVPEWVHRKASDVETEKELGPDLALTSENEGQSGWDDTDNEGIQNEQASVSTRMTPGEDHDQTPTSDNMDPDPLLIPFVETSPEPQGDSTDATARQNWKTGQVKAKISDNANVLFECCVGDCPFATRLYYLFESHIKTNHDTVLWNGECDGCEEQLHCDRRYPLEAALKHLTRHLERTYNICSTSLLGYDDININGQKVYERNVINAVGKTAIDDSSLCSLQQGATTTNYLITSESEEGISTEEEEWTSSNEERSNGDENNMFGVQDINLKRQEDDNYYSDVDLAMESCEIGRKVFRAQVRDSTYSDTMYSIPATYGSESSWNFQFSQSSQTQTPVEEDLGPTVISFDQPDSTSSDLNEFVPENYNVSVLPPGSQTPVRGSTHSIPVLVPYDLSDSENSIQPPESQVADYFEANSMYVDRSCQTSVILNSSFNEEYSYVDENDMFGVQYAQNVNLEVQEDDVSYGEVCSTMEIETHEENVVQTPVRDSMDSDAVWLTPDSPVSPTQATYDQASSGNFESSQFFVPVEANTGHIAAECGLSGSQYPVLLSESQIPDNCDLKSVYVESYQASKTQSMPLNEERLDGDENVMFAVQSAQNLKIDMQGCDVNYNESPMNGQFPASDSNVVQVVAADCSSCPSAFATFAPYELQPIAWTVFDSPPFLALSVPFESQTAAPDGFGCPPIQAPLVLPESSSEIILNPPFAFEPLEPNVPVTDNTSFATVPVTSDTAGLQTLTTGIINTPIIFETPQPLERQIPIDTGLVSVSTQCDQTPDTLIIRPPVCDLQPVISMSAPQSLPPFESQTSVNDSTVPVPIFAQYDPSVSQPPTINIINIPLVVEILQQPESDITVKDSSNFVSVSTQYDPPISQTPTTGSPETTAFEPQPSTSTPQSFLPYGPQTIGKDSTNSVSIATQYVPPGSQTPITDIGNSAFDLDNVQPSGPQTSVNDRTNFVSIATQYDTPASQSPATDVLSTPFVVDILHHPGPQSTVSDRNKFVSVSTQYDPRVTQTPTTDSPITTESECQPPTSNLTTTSQSFLPSVSHTTVKNSTNFVSVSTQYDPPVSQTQTVGSPKATQPEPSTSKSFSLPTSQATVKDSIHFAPVFKQYDPPTAVSPKIAVYEHEPSSPNSTTSSHFFSSSRSQSSLGDSTDSDPIYTIGDPSPFHTPTAGISKTTPYEPEPPAFSPPRLQIRDDNISDSVSIFQQYDPSPSQTPTVGSPKTAVREPEPSTSQYLSPPRSQTTVKDSTNSDFIFPQHSPPPSRIPTADSPKATQPEPSTSKSFSLPRSQGAVKESIKFASIFKQYDPPVSQTPTAVSVKTAVYEHEPPSPTSTTTSQFFSSPRSQASFTDSTNSDPIFTLYDPPASQAPTEGSPKTTPYEHQPSTSISFSPPRLPISVDNSNPVSVFQHYDPSPSRTPTRGSPLTTVDQSQPLTSQTFSPSEPQTAVNDNTNSVAIFTQNNPPTSQSPILDIFTSPVYEPEPSTSTLQPFESQIVEYTGQRSSITDSTPMELTIDNVCAIPSTSLLAVIIDRTDSELRTTRPEKQRIIKKRMGNQGHRSLQDGVRPNARKLEFIRNFPPPINHQEVRKFMGLISYCRRFVKNYMEIVNPLLVLSKQEDVPFVWTDDEQRSFDELKDIFMADPFLHFPDFNEGFILTTEVYDFSFSCVLSQGDIENGRVIGYGSRKLYTYEEDQSVTEKELSGIVFGVKYFKLFLENQNFTIVTTHEPLTWMISSEDLGSKMADLRDELFQYNFKLVYCNRKRFSESSHHSQPVSRRDKKSRGLSKRLQPLQNFLKFHYSVLNMPEIETISTHEMNYSPLVLFYSKDLSNRNPFSQHLRAHFDFHEVREPDNLHDVIELTTEEQTIYLCICRHSHSDQIEYKDITNSLMNLRKHLKRKNHTGRVFIHDLTKENTYIGKDALSEIILFAFKNSQIEGVLLSIMRKTPSEEEKRSVIEEHHTIRPNVHSSFRSTYARIKEKYKWKNMKNDIYDYIKRCRKCRSKNRSVFKYSKFAFKEVCVSVLGPFRPTREGNAYVMTVQDVRTQYSYGVAVQNRDLQTIAAEFEKFVNTYSIPKVICSEQGTEFVDRLIKAVSKINGLEHLLSRPCPAPESPLIFNSCLRQHITNFQGDEWDVTLPFAVFGLNSSRVSGGYAPVERLYDGKGIVPWLNWRRNFTAHQRLQLPCLTY